MTALENKHHTNTAILNVTNHFVLIIERRKLPHLVEVLEVDVPPQGEHRPDGEFQTRWVLRPAAWNKPPVHSFHRIVWSVVLIKSGRRHCTLEVESDQLDLRVDPSF